MSLLLLLRPRAEDAPAVVVVGHFDHPTPAGGAYDQPTPAAQAFDSPTPGAAVFDHPTPS